MIVPLNVRHTAAERTYALRDAGATVLFADRALDDLDPDLRVVDLDAEYDALLADAAPTEPRRAPAEHDLAGIFYTGGTTGAAKGVMLTHGNLVANAFHFMACWPFTADTSWLVVAPMFHAAGTIGALATIWAGGTQVMCPAFSADGVLDLVERHGVTATLVVPTMMDALAAEQSARPRRVSSLTWLSHGSSPAAVELLRRTHAAFPEAEMLHIYGLDRDVPDRHAAARRAAPARRPAGPLVRARGGRRRGDRRRPGRAHAAADRRRRRGADPRRQRHRGLLEQARPRPRRRCATAGSPPATSA